jgi:hypothetical protein
MRRNFLRRARARVVASLVACVAMTAMTLARGDHDHHDHRDDHRTSTEGWQTGTATWYGGSGGPGPDGMSIYTGSCAFFASRFFASVSNARDAPRATPPKQSIVLTKDDAGGYGSNLPSHYVAAINTDGGYDYGLTTQCGECWEILCVDGRQRGLSDSILGPWAGCVDPAKKSVTVMITDSCPCDHPGNPESNKRWCCGGEGGNRHWDLSYAAFDAIAIRHRGVVDVRYRRTSCDSMGEERYYE